MNRRHFERALKLALESLHEHMQELGPAGLLDAVLTMRVDGRATLEWQNAHGHNMVRTRQFYTDDDGEWFERVNRSERTNGLEGEP